MSNIPEGSVIITPSQIYDKVNTLTDAVTNLLARDAEDERRRQEEKEAAIRREAEHERQRTADAERMTSLENRLTAVERKLLLFTGAAAAAGAGIGTWLPRVLSGSA